MKSAHCTVGKKGKAARHGLVSGSDDLSRSATELQSD